jgi:Mn2+/Fe2+ NRAMP family transporter
MQRRQTMLSWRVSQILFITAIVMFLILWLVVDVRWWHSILITIGFVLVVSLIRGVILRIRVHRELKRIVEDTNDEHKKPAEP